ncbi:MAG TPA: hypothetical protein VMB34_26555 [Acetobacteraceae bacterium]|nr:hypothetical protein [Acetobacteraceae bacterium]
MNNHLSYVARENVERFETLLLAGRLDGRQRTMVETLLAQARAELASLEQHGAPPNFPTGEASRTAA